MCEIYTDVDGVFTADPRIVPTARKLDRVTYEEMLELAACGAKILHLRCVEYARRYDIPIHVRSSFSQLDGTLVVGSINDPEQQEAVMEQAIIAGVAHDRSEAKITVVGVPDKVGEAARIFDALAAGADQPRHDRAERLGRLDQPDRHLLHPAAHRRQDRDGGAARAAGRRSASTPCSTTTRSARSRWSGPGCARTRASPRSSSTRSPRPGSTSG